MEQKIVPNKLFTIFLLTILIPPFLVHSLKLAGSPSPAPHVFKPRNRKSIEGSIPVGCHSKCNQCMPCMPVEVLIRATELEQSDQYYPQVWRCMCGHKLFSP